MSSSFTQAISSEWLAGTALAQEAEDSEEGGSLGGQSLESAANDATASMWTFQLSLEGRTWLDEEGPNGEPRPEGNRDQLMRLAIWNGPNVFDGPRIVQVLLEQGIGAGSVD